MDPNYTFTFDYILYYHMNNVMLSKIFLNFMWTSKLKLSRTLKKSFGNTSTLFEIVLNTPRNAPNYVCDLDPLSKLWSQMYMCTKWKSWSKPQRVQPRSVVFLPVLICSVSFRSFEPRSVAFLRVLVHIRSPEGIWTENLWGLGQTKGHTYN